jgi:hypothetical protein
VPAAVRRVLLALTACLLLAPAVAQAASSGVQAVINDCKDGRIDQTHSLADLTAAYANLSSDVIEYTDCKSLIRRAQLAAAGAGHAKKHTGSGGSGGSGGASSGKGGGGSGGGGSVVSHTASGGSGSSGSGTSAGGGSAAAPAPSLATATPVQRAAVSKAIASGGGPVHVGHQLVSADSLGSGSSRSMPGVLVVLLVVLGLGSLGVVAASFGPRVRARRAR